MQWISVEEQVPDARSRDHYLVVCVWDRQRWVDKLYWDRYYFNDSREGPIVTHWMPLPELPPELELDGPFEPRERSICGQDRHWICYRGVQIWEVSRADDARFECDKLNEIWAQTKGTIEEGESDETNAYSGN